MDFTHIKYKILVISGGGIKALIQLGALHYFWINNSIDYTTIETYAGSSIGSVICLLLNCGMSPLDIFKSIFNLNMDFKDIVEKSSFIDMKNYWGLVSLDFLGKSLISIITSRIQDSSCDLHGLKNIPTLKELNDITKKKLIITTTNVSKMKVEYFSADTHPNLSCVDVVKMSCNLPLLFQRIRYRGNYYIDGGYLDNFPIRYVDDGFSDILAISVKTIPGENSESSTETFGEYLKNILMMPLYIITELRTEMLGKNCHVLQIPSDKGILSDTITKEEKMNMFKTGYMSAVCKFKIPETLKTKSEDEKIND